MKITNEPEIDIEVTKSKLLISSVPKGSKIYVDGKYSGYNTPDSIINLPSGMHEIILKREHYRDTLLNIQVEYDNKKEINVLYHSNPKMLGSIRCNSNPEGAQIFLNDSLTNLTTPHTFNGLIPGKYKIRYTKEKFREDSTSALVTSHDYADAYKELRDTTSWVDFRKHTSGIQSNNLNDIVIDNESNLWIASVDRGLIKYDGKEFTEYSLNTGFYSDHITVVEVNQFNELWVGSSDGLISYINGVWTFYNTSNSLLPNDYVTDIKVYSRKVCVSTLDGILYIENNNWSVIKTNQGLLSNLASSISFNRTNGDLWIGYKGFGLTKISGHDFTHYGEQFLIRGTNINSMFSTPNGNMWFSAWPSKGDIGGVTFFNYIKFYHFPNAILPTHEVNDIFVDYENIKWISTTQGLLESLNFPQYKYHSVSMAALTHRIITSSYVDRKRDVWVTTLGGGLLKYKRSSL